MKIKLFITIQLFFWGFLFPDPTDPKNQKLINYLKQINESLMKVVDLPIGSYRHAAHLERAKILVQEAIVVERIDDNATLYSIASILLNDPLYAARAVELEKAKHQQRKDTVQLARAEIAAEDQAEVYRNALYSQIQDEENILMFAENMKPEDRELHENRLKNLKKTKDWAEAQSLVHGMLKNAIYMYQNEKYKEGQ
jgi:hypothetical protein